MQCVGGVGKVCVRACVRVEGDVEVQSKSANIYIYIYKRSVLDRLQVVATYASKAHAMQRSSRSSTPAHVDTSGQIGEQEGTEK